MSTKSRNILTTLYLGRRRHRAICGDVDVTAETEIELVQRLQQCGVYIGDYHASNTAGQPNGPFSWTWVRKS